MKIQDRVSALALIIRMMSLGQINLYIALKRQPGVLPNFYNTGFWHVLWVICDVTQSDFINMLGSGAAKRLRVPL